MEGAQNEIGGLASVFVTADEEYDLAIKGAKDVCDLNANTPVQNKSQVPVIRLQDQTSEAHQQLEQKMAIAKLSSEMAQVQKERNALNIKRAHLQSKLNILKRKCDHDCQSLAAVEKEIYEKTISVNQMKSIQEDIKKLEVELDSFRRLGSPLRLLSRYEDITSLQAQITDLQEKLSSFLDLPPDYRQAREKLAIATKEEIELSSKIANLYYE